MTVTAKRMWQCGTAQPGTWTIRQSNGGAVVTVQWGASGDKLVPADYVGNDNRDEIAVYRNGAWHIRRQDGSILTINYGAAVTFPFPAIMTVTARTTRQCIAQARGSGNSHQTVLRKAIRLVIALT